jgi:hypothetical protein
MPVLAARVRRHVFSSVVSSTLIFIACPPVWAQAPAPVAGRPAPSLPATSAVLIVEPPAPGTAEPDAMWQRRLLTHVASIASEHHVRRVLATEDGEPRKTQWFKTTGDPAERASWLRDHLHVHAVPGTSLIELALPDVTDPSERRTLLLEVGNAYLASRGAVGDAAVTDRATALIRLRDKAQARLAALTVEEQQKQVQLGAGPGGAGGPIAAREIELSKLVGEQIEAATKSRNATAAYEAANAAVRDGEDPTGLEEYIRRVAPNLDNADAQFQAMEVQAEVTRQQAGEENPGYKTLSKRLDAMRAANAKRHEDAKARARVILLEEAKANAAAMNARSEGLNRRIESLKAELAELKSATLAVITLREEEKGLREQIRQIQSQLDHLAASRPAANATDIHWHLMPEALPLR